MVARRLSRTLATTIVFSWLMLLIIVLLLMFVPMIERQIAAFITKLPTYIDWVQGTLLPLVYERLGVDGAKLDLSSVYQAFDGQWQNAGGLVVSALGSMSHSGMALFGWLMNLLLIPLVTFYLLRDWKIMLEQIRNLLPRRLEPVVTRLARESDGVLGGFLRGQLLVMLVLGLVYSAGLWFIGLDLALLIGMIAGLLSFVPYLGFIVGITAAGIAAIVQYQDWVHLVPVLIVFGVGQVVEGFILIPRLIGTRIGLHPIAVIFAILAGGQLFGFTGVLLALTTTAVLVVLMRYAHGRYVHSPLYDRTPDE